MALPLGTDINVVGQGASGGDSLGATTADKISFYGTAAVSQRALAAQHTSLLSSSTDFTAAHLNALKEIMATLTATGLWKGGA